MIYLGVVKRIENEETVTLRLEKQKSVSFRKIWSRVLVSALLLNIHVKLRKLQVIHLQNMSDKLYLVGLLGYMHLAEQLENISY